MIPRLCARHKDKPAQEQSYLQSTIIASMQLELFPFDTLSPAERKAIQISIRQAYWQLRNIRGGRFGQARARKLYRAVAEQKKRLRLAGVSKREVLDFLACCRLKCSRYKQPFNPCSHRLFAKKCFLLVLGTFSRLRTVLCKFWLRKTVIFLRNLQNTVSFSSNRACRPSPMC